MVSSRLCICGRRPYIVGKTLIFYLSRRYLPVSAATGGLRARLARPYGHCTGQTDSGYSRRGLAGCRPVRPAWTGCARNTRWTGPGSGKREIEQTQRLDRN